MKSSKKIVIVFIVAILAVVTGVYTLRDKPFIDPIKNTDLPASTPPVSEWKTYENTTYHYRLKYPSTGNMGNPSSVYENRPKEIWEQVSLGAGASSYVDIFVARDYPNVVSSDKDKEGFEFFQTRKDLLASDLLSFTQKIWQYQKNKIEKDKISDRDNNYVRLRQIGEITEHSFGGMKAYTFTLTGGLDNPLGVNFIDGSLYQTNNYTFFEHKGVKFIALSTHNDKLSELILNTFEFTD